MAQPLPLPMDMREQLLQTIVYQHKMISHLKELEHKPFFSKKLPSLTHSIEKNLARNIEEHIKLLAIYGPLDEKVVRDITRDIHVLEPLPPVEKGDIGALEARLLREAFETSAGIYRHAGKKSRRMRKSRRCNKK